MLDNIKMDKQILKKWLKAGYIENDLFHHTQEGTPQGGIISPTLMVLTLQGLEAVIKRAAPKKPDKVNTIVYADDFIITAASREILGDKVKPALKAFLAERGLELSETKTKLTHINDGFNFLGFNIRKYHPVLLIKPAKQNVLMMLRNIKSVIKKQATSSAGELVAILNPKIRGWGNYYRHVVSSQTFSYVDCQLFKSLLRWSKRRHLNKSLAWIVNKYFHMGNAHEWRFQGWVKLKDGTRKYSQLVKMGQIKIVRYLVSFIGYYGFIQSFRY